MIDYDPHAHESVTIEISAPNVPHGMTMNMSMSSYLFGAVCGGAKPGEEKVLNS